VCSNYHGLWVVICDWQTIIGAIVAGLLAIVAAMIGGHWAYRAARDAAGRQIQVLEQQNTEFKAFLRNQMIAGGSLPVPRKGQEDPGSPTEARR
jgi:hypothetical protein